MTNKINLKYSSRIKDVFLIVRPQEGLLSTCEVENLLSNLLTPAERNSLQVQALRHNLMRILDMGLAPVSQHLLDDTTNEEWSGSNDKRSVSSLARGGILPVPKRGIATLAKNGQLPVITHDPVYYYDDAGDEGSSRHGPSDFYGGAPAGSVTEGKRNLGALARNFELPRPRYGKRSLASLVREGLLRRTSGPSSDKRNVATIARDRSAPSGTRVGKRSTSTEQEAPLMALRTAAAAQGGKRQKRQSDYELDNNIPRYEPRYEPDDYEELLNAIANGYPSAEKRFLGSVVRGGWFRGDSRGTAFRSPGKRHIGALARLGWLPSFRALRSNRFSRSGRAVPVRSHTADGQSEDNPVILQPSDVNNPLAYEENLPYDDYLLNENFITFLTRPKSLQRMRPNINGYDFEEDNTKP
ncbi:neuropeptide-like 1 [Ctenocephalides felis]|uniref:neuropeptide-like 1 n=1 Tax=Ctenocephalides felis TaxID=7515 RepID=UPI000E6E2E2A|nr:neuropeptide-like 1 [Ctenocephalides felis]